MGKLSGIRMVDLTQFLPGLMLTVILTDQGAEVLKIEPAAGAVDQSALAAQYAFDLQPLEPPSACVLRQADGFGERPLAE